MIMTVVWKLFEDIRGYITLVEVRLWVTECPEVDCPDQ